PMVSANWAGCTITLGVLQVRPKSRVNDIIAGLSTNRPSGVVVNLSHTWYADPTRTGSAVTEFLSLKNSSDVSAISSVVLRQVPTTRLPRTGSVATDGSTSAPGYSTDPSAAPTVQAANGSPWETVTRAPGGSAWAAVGASKVAKATVPVRMIFLGVRIHPPIA